MHAGYVGYYCNVNTGAETNLTMSVFDITEAFCYYLPIRK